MSFSRFLLLGAVALMASPAFAATTVHVSPTDNNLDAALASDMGMALGADMSKAIMQVTADTKTGRPAK